MYIKAHVNVLFFSSYVLSNSDEFVTSTTTCYITKYVAYYNVL